MSYRYVQARYDYGPRKGPVLAFVIHMAEGGGTVDYLAGSPARGVSVHYVIEYSGRIVQMLQEEHASGSINPTTLRTGDDPGGLYGWTYAKAALGDWATDPNAAVLSVEIEGFARNGPNVAQTIGLQALTVDVRDRHPTIALLGHRDFQSYKPCPGRLIPWKLIGGHGVPVEEPDMEWTSYVARGEDWNPSDRGAAGDDAPVRLTPDRAAPIVARLAKGSTLRTIAEFVRAGEKWRVTRLPDGRTGYILRGDIDPVTPGGDPAVDAGLQAYVQRSPTDCATELARFKQAAIACIEGVPT